jgi:hypothetical protein
MYSLCNQGQAQEKEKLENKLLVKWQNLLKIKLHLYLILMMLQKLSQQAMKSQ